MRDLENGTFQIRKSLENVSIQFCKCCKETLVDNFLRTAWIGSDFPAVELRSVHRFEMILMSL